MFLLKQGHEKTHYAVVLSCADGTKLPPLSSFMRKMPPKKKLPKRVFEHVDTKG